MEIRSLECYLPPSLVLQICHSFSNIPQGGSHKESGPKDRGSDNSHRDLPQHNDLRVSFGEREMRLVDFLLRTELPQVIEFQGQTNEHTFTKFNMMIGEPNL